MRRSVSDQLATTGLATKGVVYIIIGAMAFLSAFELTKDSEENATRSGAFEWMQDTGGSALLIAVAVGLFCYAAWRFVQAFSRDEKLRKRLRYVFSGLVYGSVAFSAFKLAVYQQKKNGDQNQSLAAELLNKPLGQALVMIAALVFIGNGIYQLYYALSDRYAKHLKSASVSQDVFTVLLKAGKMGYCARGVVWLLIGYLLVRAAVLERSSEAGDTGKAFSFVADSFMGSYILGAIAIGLVAYGVFNIARARYEAN